MQMHELLDYGGQQSEVFICFLELTYQPTVCFFAGSALCVFHGMWLSMALEDSSAFHQLPSNTAYHLQSHDPVQQQFRLEDSSHQISAIRLLKKRFDTLPREEPMNLVRSVAALAVRANINGDYIVWKMHMQAVQKIVTLRNLKSFDDIPECIRCLLFWVDVSGALGRDDFPFFPVPKCLPLPCIRITEHVQEELRYPQHLIRETLSSWEEKMSFLQTLQRIKRLNTIIDLHSDLWPGSSEVCFTVMRLLLQLICLRSDTLDASDHSGNLREVVRIAAMIGLTETTDSVEVAFLVQEAQFAAGNLGVPNW